MVQGAACVDAVAQLVELGADTAAAAAQKDLEAPLAIAVRCGRPDIVTRLLRCGMPLDSRSKVGRTPDSVPLSFWGCL